ncbi:uncharacterized protein LOC133546030 [Nerophis ophidion]|uniref:uncharacterized protein LOC133546030 n=1 Tax=Nerophis ophidion TaxID=159077 RepID=UPI002ADF4DD0|nr:uncharacterized protein LOC133546030 [Nerophis ophidion]XP_061747822.1 uncharacterized protein LOC133546030 [Nerophis ophidion]XP_061747823.1 uncharacterized protein LOC133546030 [Nerophis ophidion]XP_061747825.1 uncharacterized protein LOC133546030 [Nerophis ophidion]XP_061747826.1 uncharacterized protein LOC133546030 [Nerophis ophidion]XP_061747827.1 uncharacterized protein LOC133546030 [Nerophis ophidion]
MVPQGPHGLPGSRRIPGTMGADRRIGNTGLKEMSDWYQEGWIPARSGRKRKARRQQPRQEWPIREEERPYHHPDDQGPRRFQPPPQRSYAEVARGRQNTHLESHHRPHSWTRRHFGHEEARYVQQEPRHSAPQWKNRNTAPPIHNTRNIRQQRFNPLPPLMPQYTPQNYPRNPPRPRKKRKQRRDPPRRNTAPNNVHNHNNNYNNYNTDIESNVKAKCFYNIIKITHHQNIVSKKDPPQSISKMEQTLATMIRPAVTNPDTDELIKDNAQMWAEETIFILRHHYREALKIEMDKITKFGGEDWRPAFQMASTWTRRHLGRRLMGDTLRLAEAQILAAFADLPVNTEVTRPTQALPRPPHHHLGVGWHHYRQHRPELVSIRGTRGGPPSTDDLLPPAFHTSSCSFETTLGTEEDTTPPSSQQISRRHHQREAAHTALSCTSRNTSSESTCNTGPCYPNTRKGHHTGDPHTDPGQHPTTTGVHGRTLLIDLDNEVLDFVGLTPVTSSANPNTPPDCSQLFRDLQKETAQSPQAPTPVRPPFIDHQDSPQQEQAPEGRPPTPSSPPPSTPLPIPATWEGPSTPTTPHSPTTSDSAEEVQVVMGAPPQKPTRHPNTSRKMSDWKLSTNRRILIVGDSNLAHIPPFHRNDLQIDSYPGANFRHAEALLARARVAVQVEVLVLAFGLNNCEQKVKETTIKQLQGALRAARNTFPTARVVIPLLNYSADLPLEEIKQSPAAE